MSKPNEEGDAPPSSSVYSQLLATATAAKGDERMEPTLAAMSAEKRAWLEGAIREMASDADPIRNLKAAISRLSRCASNTNDLNELAAAVEALRDLICDLDLAADFCKLDGLVVLDKLLVSTCLGVSKN